jgi:hypothetical protein
MKRYVILFVVLVAGLLSGCRGTEWYKEYEDIGSFPNRVAAEQNALRHFQTWHGRLSNKDDTKVLFAFKSRGDTLWSNAVWYHKKEHRLVLETDIHSGISCSWEGVDKPVLDELVRQQRGLIAADSLAQPGISSYARVIR